MRCCWCKIEIVSGEKFSVITVGRGGDISPDIPLKAVFHRHCLIKYEREVLWGLKEGGSDVSESATPIRETPTSPYGA